MGDSTKNDDLLVRFDSDDGNHFVVVEVDQRVAYAYLLKDQEIIGDVWLYNVDATPTDVDWKDTNQMPFLNPRPYCTSQPPPDLRCDVQCRWDGATAEILSQGQVVARLAPGAKPGWSTLARKDGPLAKKLGRP